MNLIWLLLSLGIVLMIPSSSFTCQLARWYKMKVQKQMERPGILPPHLATGTQTTRLLWSSRQTIHG